MGKAIRNFKTATSDADKEEEDKKIEGKENS
jgi:Sec-independent protein translocase protein TatA